MVGSGCGRGGIIASMVIPIEDLISTTTAAGVVTAFVLDTGKSFTKYTPDDEEDIAIFEAVQENPRGKHNVRALFSVNGVGAIAVAAARGFDGCCGLVAVHYLSNGSAFVQGLVLDSDTAAVTSTGKAQARTSLLGGTAAQDSRTEVEILSTDIRMVPTTDITLATLEALVGP